MSDINLGKTIEKIIGRIKREKAREVGEVASQSIGFEKIPSQVYLKALPLRALEDVNLIKREVRLGNILIVKVSPLARRSIEDVKRAVNELCEFVEIVGGDIARLGEERVVITPSFVKIWRERSVASGSSSTVA